MRMTIERFAAILVGCAVILTIVSVFVGVDVAGVVGVPFTAAITVILSRSEWRIQQSGADRQPAEVSWFWYFLTLTLAILGTQFLLAMLLGVLLAWTFPSPDQGIQGIWDVVEMLMATPVLIGFIVLNCLSYFIGGLLCGKTASNIRYRHAAFSSLAVCGINAAPFVALTIAIEGALLANTLWAIVLWFGLYSLLYVLMALAGTRVGSRRSFSRSVFGQAAGRATDDNGSGA